MREGDQRAVRRAWRLLGGPRWQVIAGVVLLALWLGWWAASMARPLPALIGGGHTWMEDVAWPFAGLDFMHDCAGGRALAQGQNPYRKLDGHPFYDRFTYPPLVLPLFAWCNLVPPDTSVQIPTDAGVLALPYPRDALRLWTVAAALAFLAAALAAARTRSRLGLDPIAPPLAAALVVLSFPVVFGMERGSCDWLMLVPIVISGHLLSTPGRKESGESVREIGAGVLVGLAAWIKLYPAVLVLTLLALGRRRAAAAAVATTVAVGLATWPWTMQWLDVVHGHLHVYYPQLEPYAHTVSGQWSLLTKGLGPLALLPGLLGACALLGPLAGFVLLRLRRSEEPAALSLPALLWTTALATFLPVISFDYNLFYLPLAAVAVAHRRDAVWIRVGLLLLALAMQPFALVAQSGALPLVLKLVGLVAVGASLVAKSSPR